MIISGFHHHFYYLFPFFLNGSRVIFRYIPVGIGCGLLIILPLSSQTRSQSSRQTKLAVVCIYLQPSFRPRVPHGTGFERCWHRGLIKEITQTAVINIVFQRIIYIELDVSYASQHTFLRVTVTTFENYISVLYFIAEWQPVLWKSTKRRFLYDIYSVDVLSHVWGRSRSRSWSDPKLLNRNNNNNHLVWLKMGKWVTKSSNIIQTSAPCTPRLC